VAGSGEHADGDDPSGRQRPDSMDRTGGRHGKAQAGSKSDRTKANGRGKDKPGRAKNT
jgi:hypothetical protein